MKCLCTLFHVSCPWSSLRFQGVWVYSFHQIWGNVGHYFHVFFCLFVSSVSPGCQNTHILDCLKFSHSQLMLLFILRCFLLTFCISLGISSIIFIKYHNIFSEMPNLLLILLNIYLRYYNFHL